MSKHFRPYEPKQPLLMPPSLEEWLPEDHMARFLNDVVGELDLKEIYRPYEKEDRGFPPYEPGMMTRVLFYAYVMGVPSSRKIERRLHDDVAFRYLAAGNQPDYRTIAEFRRRHLDALAKLFTQVIQLCQEAGLVKLGHVALDGTKVKASASKHKAMSYDRMVKAEVQIETEIRELLKRAEETDAEEDRQFGRDKRGDELPQELSRRISRLEKIREAKAALEAKAKKDADERRSARAQHEETARQECRSPGPKPTITDTPDPKAQRNFTDPESGIMKGSDGGFVQAYNCQAAVDSVSQVIVACEASPIAADSVQAESMMFEVLDQTGQLPDVVSMDAGYFSETNVEGLEYLGIDPYIAAGRKKHTDKPVPPRGRIPAGLTPRQLMERKLRTSRGRRIYSRRKAIVEPVFGQIKGRGFRQFLLRGLHKVRGEWKLIAATHNLLKLYGKLGGRWTRN